MRTPDPQGSLYQLTQDTLGAGNETPNHLGEGRRDPAKPHLFQDVEATQALGKHPVHLRGGGKDPPPPVGTTNHEHLLQGEATGGQEEQATCSDQDNPTSLGDAGEGETDPDASDPGNQGEIDRNAHPCVISGPRLAYANRPMAAPSAAPSSSSRNSGRPSRRPSMWAGLPGVSIACMLPTTKGHSTDDLDDALNGTSARSEPPHGTWRKTYSTQASKWGTPWG